MVEKAILSSATGYKGKLPHSPSLEQVPQRGCAISIPEGFQYQTESSPELPGLTSWLMILPGEGGWMRCPEGPLTLNCQMIQFMLKPGKQKALRMSLSS